MEIIIISILWFVVLYIVRLKKELTEYKKYFTQHNDIYVPSYKELIENNNPLLQTARFVFAQLKSEPNKHSKLIIPAFKKRLNEMAMVLAGKKN